MPYRLIVIAMVVVSSSALVAQTQTQPATSGYLLPPKAIVDILDAPPPPTVELSPTRDVVALLERASMPTHRRAVAADAAARRRAASTRAPTVRIARSCRASITLKAIADGAETQGDAAAQPDAVVDRLLARRQALRVHAAARQRHRAVGRRYRHGTGQVGHDRAVERGARHALRMGRRRRARCCASSCPPTAARRQRAGVPTGPNIQEHRGGIAPVRTYQDLLTSAHDEALFDYYATSQLAFVDADERSAHAGRHARGLRDGRRRRPTANFILVRRVRRPYSWLVPYTNFPASVEVWDRKGAQVKQIARAADGRHRAERRRAARAAQLPVAAARAGDRRVGGGARQRRSEDQGAASRQGDDAEPRRSRPRPPSWRGPSTASAASSWTDAGAVLLTENDRDAALDAHLDHRQAGRHAAQAVGSQPGGLVRQSRARRSAVSARRASSTIRQSGNASSSPASAPRRKARGRSSIGSTSPRSRPSACSRPPAAPTRP